MLSKLTLYKNQFQPHKDESRWSEENEVLKKTCVEVSDGNLTNNIPNNKQEQTKRRVYE